MRKTAYTAIGVVVLVVMVSLAGCSNCAANNTGPKIRAPSSGSIQGKATLVTEQSDVLTGQYILLTVRFHNTGPGRWFYNPAFDPAIPAPAVLAVYSPKHEYVGNLLTANAAAVPTPQAWVFVPTGGTVEGTISVPTAYFPGKPGMVLKPATYTLQLIYSEAFATPQPAPDTLDGSLFHAQLANLGLMASNTISVHLTALPKD